MKFSSDKKNINLIYLKLVFTACLVMWYQGFEFFSYLSYTIALIFIINELIFSYVLYVLKKGLKNMPNNILENINSNNMTNALSYNIPHILSASCLFVAFIFVGNSAYVDIITVVFASVYLINIIMITKVCEIIKNA